MGSRTTRETSTSTLSDDSARRRDANVARVRGLLDASPFQSFEGDRVAGLTDTQQEARGQFLQGQGQGSALVGEASDLARQAGGFTPDTIEAQSFAGADLDPFLNPFLENVVDTNLQDIDRQRQLALNQGASAATQASAFGGSRQGVAEAETNRAFGDIAARTSAGLRSDAFNQAAGLFGRDADRNLQAATTNANLGLAGQGLNLQGAGLLGQFGQFQDESNRANAGLLNMFGQQDQATQQASLDAAYQEFLRQQDDPFRRAQVEQGILGTTPITTNTTGTQTTPGPGVLGILGAGAQAASLFSDRRLKTDIKKIGKRGEHNWYSFKYVWDKAKTHFGVMADEVKALRPDLVTRHESGFDQVNYGGL